MKAPNKIYVEVCEDGIFAFPEPPFKESVEYIRADLVQQEQPQVADASKMEQPVDGLEEEITRYLRDECSSDDEPSVSEIARHFYELGRNARKEEK